MRNFVVIDAEQRSDEWHRARLGRLTGSVAKDMLAKLATGKPAAGRENLCIRLVLERLTGKPQESGYQSPAMATGVDREADAFAAYEALTGTLVDRTGFLSHTTLMAGASLDGHLGDFEKLLSIKCRQPKAHWAFLRTGKVPGDALVQMRHELWLTGASEHDYFSWNPDFEADKQSGVLTVKAKDLDLPGYEAEVLKFLAEVDREVSLVKGWKAVAVSA